MSVAEIVDLNRISTLQKLLRLTCFLNLIVEKRTFRVIVHCLSADEFKKAEDNWIRHVQKDLPKDVMYRIRRLGPQLTSDGIIIVGQRMKKWIENSWNRTSFALVLSSHPFAEFIVKEIHGKDHA